MNSPPPETNRPIVFEYPFEVRQRDVDQFDRMTPGALYGSMQDAALAHSAARGLSGPALLELGYVWMLNRIHLSIDTAPVLLDQLTIQTWGSDFSGLYAVREYHVLNQVGDILARATSRWLTINVAKKRAVRMPEFIEPKYGVRSERGIDDSFEKMKLDPLPEHSKTFRVDWSHLDSNRHANSAFYFDWIVDAMPTDVLETSSLKDFELEYKKELVHGDTFTTHCARVGDTFEHVIRDTDDALIAQARSRWS
jgi:medium-chain acyl-[acyl-carrier-protein] hydrolase